MQKRRLALSTIAYAAIVLIAPISAALAQSDYPSKPVKIIAPFPAGGTSDVMGRLVAEELGKILKQPFIVENIGGAGGVVRPVGAQGRVPADHRQARSRHGAGHGFASSEAALGVAGLHRAAAGRQGLHRLRQERGSPLDKVIKTAGIKTP